MAKNPQAVQNRAHSPIYLKAAKRTTAKEWNKLCIKGVCIKNESYPKWLLSSSSLATPLSKMLILSPCSLLTPNHPSSLFFTLSSLTTHLFRNSFSFIIIINMHYFYRYITIPCLRLISPENPMLKVSLCMKECLLCFFFVYNKFSKINEIVLKQNISYLELASSRWSIRGYICSTLYTEAKFCYAVNSLNSLCNLLYQQQECLTLRWKIKFFLY